MRVLSKCLINWITDEIDEKELSESAIFFSPHPDDETMNCGGTIIKKKKAHADIKIVFLTNGEKSHHGLIEAKKLADLRAHEAIIAGQMMGLMEDDLFFLRFGDGELSHYQQLALKKVEEIIRLYQPDEVFVPYPESTPIWTLDHLTTNRIVKLALQGYGREVTLYEYPAWLWYDPPWLEPFNDAPRQLITSIKQRLTSRYNLLRDFRCSVDIRDVLDIKREVLNQYKSQMVRLIPDCQWHTLGDVSKGKFLECFFQEHELFSAKTVRGHLASPLHR